MSSDHQNHLDGEPLDREQVFAARRARAHLDFIVAQRTLQAAPPASRARALARLDECRRVCVSLSSVAAPTSSDEEIGGATLFAFQGRAPNRPEPDESSSDEEYFSSSSSDTSDSDNGYLAAAKAKIWADYQHWPGDVPLTLATVAQQPAAAGGASTSQNQTKSTKRGRPVHAAGCRSLRDAMAHCDCSVKTERLERRKARKDARLQRWFARKVAEEGGADGDHEGDGAAANWF
ncbi:hypothetical protein C8R47DRAFT_1230215 [Mycena vitilis]|nr:hypothetical protein C8R47DRAFT_1230215 [Mycena vitilis]